ncbi:MAG: BREX-1 system adenine-specific DNA-methyltransferase PglX, partial [Fastidiosipilaceae bacterium]
MNKSAVEKFAVWARKKLVNDITYKAGLVGITSKGISVPLSHSTEDAHFYDIGTKQNQALSGTVLAQRQQLVEVIRRREKMTDYQTAFDSVIEEVAYTWFNRLIALRFMEVNDYLPSRVRVLSSETPGKQEPDVVTVPFETNFVFSEQEKTRIKELNETNDLDTLFRLLFIKQCNQLHLMLPDLFEKTADYSELLLPLSFTDREGIVFRLIQAIPEADFSVEQGGHIEIIGWLYQFYNSQKRREIFDFFKQRVITKKDIPAATQLFTTDWVVKYIVDNSLGRYWIERNPQSSLINQLEFLVLPKDGSFQQIDEIIQPEDLTFFDPCMGSGHILLYAFDVLLKIYLECGYSKKDAAIKIIKHNLSGLDIDPRAHQLAYFSLMMKARSCNRRALTETSPCSLAAFEESNEILTQDLVALGLDEEQVALGRYLLKTFYNAREMGSILKVEKRDYAQFIESLNDFKQRTGQLTLDTGTNLDHVISLLKKLASQAMILSQSYAVVCTNPPYFNKFDAYLKNYIDHHYKDYGKDLFSIFIYRNFDFCKPGGYSGFMTPLVWMFIKTYEPLRQFIIKNKSITTLIQMEYSAFEEATVPICAFVLGNSVSSKRGQYIRLTSFKGGMDIQREKVLAALNANQCSYFYEENEQRFLNIPGSPIAYWASDQIINLFVKALCLDDYAKPRQGLITGDNNRFLRLWFEVSWLKLTIGEHTVSKWVPLNKGGAFRRWYGNQEYVVNWEKDGDEIINFKDQRGKQKSRPQNLAYNFRESVSWSLITSGEFAARYYSDDFIFNVAGMSCFPTEHLAYILGLLNSKVV